MEGKKQAEENMTVHKHLEYFKISERFHDDPLGFTDKFGGAHLRLRLLPHEYLKIYKLW